MKIFVTVFALLGIIIALDASGIPMDPYSTFQSSGSHTYNSTTENLPDMRIAPAVGVENNPFYYGLTILTLAERQNASIGIEFMLPVSEDVKIFAQEIELLWNSEYFEEALALFAELNQIEGVKGNALIGISWRTPIPAPVSDWADDVQISARDSVFVLAMDHSFTNDNLFAVIGFTGDGVGSRWTVNFSSDGGYNWAETFALGGFSYVMNDLDGCVVGGHFHVLYTGGTSGSPNTMTWHMRFDAADGQQVTLPNGAYSYNIFNASGIEDVDFSSNHEQFDNRLYFYCIDDAGTIHNYWNNPTNVTWTGIATNINDAQQGLDTDWNLDYSTHSSILSYINNADQVKIYGRDGNTWDLLITYGILNTPFDDFTTGIGGYNDTLFCAFSYDGAYMQVRYLVQYGDGGSWYFGFLAPDTLESNWTPDVTLRGGGGTHGVYRGPSTAAGYYRYRGYAGAWSTPEQFNDYSMSGEIKPQIEYVGSSAYGILYRRPMASLGICYFDRSDWEPGIVENKSSDITTRFITLAPNPSRGSSARLSYVVTNQGHVNIAVYDAAGRIVKTLVNESKPAGDYSITMNNDNLASGIYFVRVETPDGVNTKPMTIVR